MYVLGIFHYQLFRRAESRSMRSYSKFLACQRGKMREGKKRRQVPQTLWSQGDFFFFSPQTFYELSLAREKETGTRTKTAWSLTRPSGKHFSRLTTSLWSLRTSKLTHIIHVDWREPRHTPWNWSNTHQRYFIYWTYYFNFWDYRMSCYNSSWYSALQKESALSNIHSNHLKLIKFENAAVDDS